MCVTGYCSAKQVTSVCPNMALQTIAAPQCAALTTATTTASARTTRASYQCAGKNTQTVTLHLSGKMCSSMCLFSVCPSCLVGEDFWYMGQRCDVRMTRARLVGTCLAILLVMVTVIGVSAFVAVRRYRAILIEAKVDQTRSRYTLS